MSDESEVGHWWQNICTVVSPYFMNSSAPGDTSLHLHQLPRYIFTGDQTCAVDIRLRT